MQLNTEDIGREINKFHSRYIGIMKGSEDSPFQKTIAADLFSWLTVRSFWNEKSKDMYSLDIDLDLINSIYSLDEPVSSIVPILFESKKFHPNALDALPAIVQYLESTNLMIDFVGFKQGIFREREDAVQRDIVNELNPAERRKYNELNGFENNRSSYFRAEVTNFRKQLFAKSIPPTAFFSGGEAYSYGLMIDKFGEITADKYFIDIDADMDIK